MKILISNDDGIFATGVRTLANTLAVSHQVTVVCPDRERSATGHALTLHKPLRADPVSEGYAPSIRAWACSGTPSDCVKLGLDGLMSERPDWVVSGINHGSNLGTDVLYSGTVSAAMEGYLEGIPSMAVSLASSASPDFSSAATVVQQLLQKLQADPLSNLTLLNVNIPAGTPEERRGMVLVPLGIRKYRDIYEKRLDPRGKTYYWLAGEAVDEEVTPNSDIQALLEQFVTITPLQPDLSDRQSFAMLTDWGLSGLAAEC
ncbi:MAG: 5'/3'-nucleotidase SurE [Cyanobacteriota bacterium]|nr:5'/3'-nucleotidase SurE [Cyanobacteriota bacterium]